MYCHSFSVLIKLIFIPGVQTQRLGEVSEDSESVSKKLNLLYDELESYKEQCKSLKQEMEEQERSLKSQNAALEKKQHESWVTVRQETRKLTDAQNEMQTLRTRLTLAETKLAEKTVEMDKIGEENRAMKETMDRINNHQIVKPDPSKYFSDVIRRIQGDNFEIVRSFKRALKKKKKYGLIKACAHSRVRSKSIGSHRPALNTVQFFQILTVQFLSCHPVFRFPKNIRIVEIICY